LREQSGSGRASWLTTGFGSETELLVTAPSFDQVADQRLSAAAMLA
jgi:hypothetical protein